MHEYAQRQQLHNEIHARPYERLVTPLQISHMAFLADATEQAQAHAHLCLLLGNHHLPLPAESSGFYVADIGLVRLRWERHGEFTSYTFIRQGLAGEEQAWFDHCACADISAEWRESIPGALLSANHIALPPDHQAPGWPQPNFESVLDADALVASEVADGQARVYTDLRIHADGFARFVVMSHAMSPRRRGRLAQRLLEIETYRMLALLALPAARSITPLLGQHEQELAQIMDAIRSGEPGRDRQTLERLTQLASIVESLYAQHHARFTASSVYYELVNRRIADLLEEQFLGLQTLGQFMDRRLAPAMQTCNHVMRRMQGLSERISRCSNLLRTRVEVQVQQQNRELLSSLNRRQYLQLRLQQTVEGLSVAAITYYASSLVGHLFEASHRWLHIDAMVAQGWSIPFIALAAWLGLRRAHQRLVKQNR
jgi:uncharacterized membrane-anchored protein